MSRKDKTRVWIYVACCILGILIGVIVTPFLCYKYVNEDTDVILTETETKAVMAAHALANVEDYESFEYNANIVLKYEAQLLGITDIPEIEVFDIEGENEQLAQYYPDTNTIRFQPIIVRIKPLYVIEALTYCVRECYQYYFEEQNGHPNYIPQAKALEDDAYVYAQTRVFWYNDMMIN